MTKWLTLSTSPLLQAGHSLLSHLPADPEHDGETAQSAQEFEPRTFEVAAIVKVALGHKPAPSPCLT